MRKTIAGYYKDGQWVEQRHVEMHPLEEAAVSAHQNHIQVFVNFPKKLTLEEEHELLIEGGAELVKKKRAEREVQIKDYQAVHDAAHDAFQAAHKIWCDHANACVAKGLNPDTHKGKI